MGTKPKALNFCSQSFQIQLPLSPTHALRCAWKYPRCLAHYDNSAANPANPNPKETVRWGEQTFEEMMIGYLEYIPEDERSR